MNNKEAEIRAYINEFKEAMHKNFAKTREQRIILESIFLFAEEDIVCTGSKYNKVLAAFTIRNAIRQVIKSKMYRDTAFLKNIEKWISYQTFPPKEDYSRKETVSEEKPRVLNTYYTRLGVGEKATQDEIKKAYREKVLRNHPDLNQNSEESKSEFIRIQKAFEVLSDEDRRKKYDSDLLKYRTEEFLKRYRHGKEAQAQQSPKQDVKPRYDGKKKPSTRIGSLFGGLVFLVFISVIFFLVSNSSDSGGDDEHYSIINFRTGDSPYGNHWGVGKYNPESLSYLLVKNGTDTDAVVVLTDNFTNKPIRNVYVSSMSSYKLDRLPEGTYSMKCFYGKRWSYEVDNGVGNPTGGFTQDVSFSSSSKKDLLSVYFEYSGNGVDYPTYEVTLHKVAHGNMKTKRISRNDFFK